MKNEMYENIYENIDYKLNNISKINIKKKTKK